jgi:hypothetical protein
MNAQEIRNLFEAALPEAAHAETTLEPGHMYLPTGHNKAIALDRPIVVGDRGAGKSFWLRSLVDPVRRELIGELFDFPSIIKCDVVTGFDPTSTGNYPDPRVLAGLVENAVVPTDIWHAVIVHACLPKIIPSDIQNWKERIEWINKNAEAVAQQLRERNSELAASGRVLLVAFDGLDRLDSNWNKTISLARGLLQAQLDFTKYTNLRTKAFIRPDLFSDPEIRRFPDASKLISLAVKLEWEPIDLYGLMWQYLANSGDVKSSVNFREFSKKRGNFKWISSKSGVFVLSDSIRYDGSEQESFFHLISGKTMGGGTKSGNPWTWLPKHLADANGYTSPRSFLVALRSAAVDSKKRKFVGIEFALHPSSIKEGVSKASAVRRNELEENLPWISDIFLPLKGLSLPSRRQDVVSRWRRAETLKTLLSANTSVPLPDKINGTDAGSILAALEQMGLCRVLADGRVDFPDIVRVDAGMTRKGGIPVR